MIVRKHFAITAFIVLLAILVAIFAATRTYPQITGEIGENIDIGVDVPDMSFFSADEIKIRVTSTDDVFAAGGTVDVNSTTADHLVVAGGEITIRSSTIEDLIAAGGEVNLSSGTVTDDIVVAGGEITVGPAFAIGGSAVVAGGKARVETAIPVDLRVGAGDVYVNSVVGGDARLSGDTVTLGPKARIEGNLFYQTDSLVMEPGAMVVGSQSVLPPEEQSALEDWGRGAGELAAIAALATMVSFTILVIAIAAAAPSLMRSSSAMIRAQPLRSVAIGALIAIIAPFSIIALFFSVLGTPLGLLILVMCLAITPVALAATAFLIGVIARSFVSKENGENIGWIGRLLWPALGAAVIALLGMIPVAGFLVWLLAILFGLGAVASKGGKALAQKA